MVHTITTAAIMPSVMNRSKNHVCRSRHAASRNTGVSRECLALRCRGEGPPDICCSLSKSPPTSTPLPIPRIGSPQGSPPTSTPLPIPQIGSPPLLYDGACCSRCIVGAGEVVGVGLGPLWLPVPLYHLSTF